MKTEDKKIAVIGIGGVGGYVAGMLAKAYPHVTMVARGARGESIRENGLVLHSDYKGRDRCEAGACSSSPGNGTAGLYFYLCKKLLSGGCM